MSKRNPISVIEQFVAVSPNFPNARCKEIAEPNIFFPDSKVEFQENYKQIMAICRSCVHQTECALYAINYEMEYGIWGGVPAEHRKRIWSDNNRFTFLHRKGRSCRDLVTQGWTYKEIAKRYRATEEKVKLWIQMFEESEVHAEEIAIYLS